MPRISTGTCAVGTEMVIGSARTASAPTAMSMPATIARPGVSHRVTTDACGATPCALLIRLMFANPAARQHQSRTSVLPCGAD